jgi:hypothetical protein
MKRAPETQTTMAALAITHHTTEMSLGIQKSRRHQTKKISAYLKVVLLSENTAVFASERRRVRGLAEGSAETGRGRGWYVAGRRRGRCVIGARVCDVGAGRRRGRGVIGARVCDVG